MKLRPGQCWRTERTPESQNRKKGPRSTARRFHSILAPARRENRKKFSSERAEKLSGTIGISSHGFGFPKGSGNGGGNRCPLGPSGDPRNAKQFSTPERPRLDRIRNSDCVAQRALLLAAYRRPEGLRRPHA